jgi:hypothetical protein
MDRLDPLDFMDNAISTSATPTPTASSTEGNTHAQRHQHIPDSA